MPTDFQSYDLNRDGVIGEEEWAQFYDMNQGPANADPMQGQGFDLNAFMQKVESGQFTDDDLLAFQNYLVAQQLGNEAGQLDLEGRKLDLGGRQLDVENRQVDLSEEELAQKYQEFEFMRDQYFPWYTGDYFEFQKEQAANEMSMSNNQVSISNNQVTQSEHDIQRAKESAMGQLFNRQSAQYGAEQARYQYLRDTGLGGGSRPSTPFLSLGY